MNKKLENVIKEIVSLFDKHDLNLHEILYVSAFVQSFVQTEMSLEYTRNKIISGEP